MRTAECWVSSPGDQILLWLPMKTVTVRIEAEECSGLSRFAGSSVDARIRIITLSSLIVLYVESQKPPKGYNLPGGFILAPSGNSSSYGTQES